MTGRIEHRKQPTRLIVIGFLAVALSTVGLLVDRGFASASPSHHTSALDSGHGHSRSSQSAVAQREAFHDAMRQLWEEHVWWIRLFIVSDVAALPDLGATTDRLLRNQVDIGNAIRPFYGDQAADQLTGLLRQHILQAADILAAAKAGDTQALAAAKAAWYANANDIAVFLHNLNPRQWPLDQLQMMMRQHLDLTLTEAVDQLRGNFA